MIGNCIHHIFKNSSNIHVKMPTLQQCGFILKLERHCQTSARDRLVQHVFIKCQIYSFQTRMHSGRMRTARVCGFGEGVVSSPRGNRPPLETDTPCLCVCVCVCVSVSVCLSVCLFVCLAVCLGYNFKIAKLDFIFSAHIHLCTLCRSSLSTNIIGSKSM